MTMMRPSLPSVNVPGSKYVGLSNMTFGLSLDSILTERLIMSVLFDESVTLSVTVRTATCWNTWVTFHNPVPLSHESSPKPSPKSQEKYMSSLSSRLSSVAFASRTIVSFSTSNVPYVSFFTTNDTLGASESLTLTVRDVFFQ